MKTLIVIISLDILAIAGVYMYIDGHITDATTPEPKSGYVTTLHLPREYRVNTIQETIDGARLQGTFNH